MASLLARLPGVGDGAAEDWTPRRTWVAAAAGAAVPVAGLAGLSLAIVVVSTLDPTGGLPVGGAIGLAGRLWLLAHGASLGLASGPVHVAPLLLTLAAAWGYSRAGRFAVRATGATAARAAATTAAVVAAVPTALTVLLGAVLDAPGASVGLLPALAGAAALTTIAGGWGGAREAGALDALLDRLPGATRAVLRGVLAGGMTLLALCVAIVGVALASDAPGYAALSGSLGGAGAGALGLVGLALLLLPNAAAAVLGLAAGPGFVVGSGTVVSVHGVDLGPVPALPLLAALPDTQAVPLLAFVSQAVPAVAGLVAGATLGRWMADRDGGSVVAGLWGVVAGLLLGVLAAAATWLAGGGLGDGALAVVGAPPLETGIAVAAQAGMAAVLAAAVTRWRSLG